MRRLITILLLFICAASYGQHNAFIEIAKDGALSDGLIKPIFRDSRGFMWFGTGSGICRYDGYDTAEYKLDFIDNGGATISSINEIEDGRLMIKAGRDIYVYSFEDDTIVEMYTEILKEFDLPEGNVFTDENKNLWVDAEEGLYCHMSSQRRNIQFNDRIHIKDICTNGSTTVILSDDGRFFTVDFVRDRLVQAGKIELSQYEWHYIILDNQQNIWFFTAHSPVDGLKGYSLAESRWMELKGLEDVNSSIITSIVDDGNGKIWIGTEDEGFFIYDSSQGKAVNIRKSTPQYGDVLSNHISRIYNDREGHIWMSFNSKGVSYANIKDDTIGYLQCDIEEDISSLCEDDKGNIWIGSDGDGILRINRDGSTNTLNKANKGISSDIVTCLYEDSKGHLLAGTFGDGVMTMKNGRFENMTFQDIPEYKTAYIREIIEDSVGSLWLINFTNEIVRVFKDGHATMLDSEFFNKPGNNTHCLAGDMDGLMFIGCTQGLYVYDCIEEKFLDFFDKAPDLKHLNIISLATDDKDHVWIGSDTSVIVFDKKTGESIKEFPFSASSITTDNLGSVWITSDKGLVRVRQNGLGQFIIDGNLSGQTRDGKEYKNSRAICTADGRYMSSKGNRILCINSPSIESREIDGKVVFTGLTVKGMPIRSGDESGILRDNISLTEAIRLRHDQNNIKISLSILNISLVDIVSYEYRIKDSGDEWFEIEENDIMLNQLPCGSFTLEARASDNWGWYSEPISLKITVSYPWWRSPFMIFIYIMMITGMVVWSLSKVKNNQLLQKELERQKELDENKMRFITNINHDIRTPLSLIISPLEKVLKSKIDGEIRQDIDLSLRNAKVLMEEFNQLIDVRKLEVGTESLHPTQGDIVSYIRNVVSAYVEMASNESIQLVFMSDESIIKTDFDQLKMRRILLNLISNAVKYNHPGGSVTVSVTKDSYNNVSICVADTGSGIKDKDKELVFNRFYQCNTDDVKTGSGIGLHIVKEYTELHGGKIEITDNKPCGTCFTITLPISHEAKEEENEEITELSRNGEKKMILIVEDNKEFNEFLKKCLQTDYDVITATNGKEALGMMSGTEVDLVISDVMMPHMDGLELCKYIKENLEYSHIPVILLTAKSREEDVIQGLSRGADDYLAKPFNLDILHYRIQKIFEWSEKIHKEISKGVDLEPSKITVSSLDESLIDKCIKTVEENIDDEEFSVEDLSRAVGMTRGHLYKKLMVITGKSPIQFIRIIKIKRGKALLEQGRTNIAEVAYSVGFSPKQFSKHFKETYGCLPSEFLNGINK